MLKKLTAVILAALMALSFAACTSEKDMRGSVASDNNTSNTSEKGSADAEADNNAEISMGVSNKNHYENSYIGIQCSLDSEWTFKTDEEIKEINQQAAGMMSDDYSEMLEKANVISDMYATHSNLTSTVNVNMEKLAVANYGITEEKYAQLSIKTVTGGYESAGMTNIKTDIADIEFAGNTHSCIKMSSEYNGAEIYQTAVIIKCKGAIAIVTATTYYEDGTAEILNNFSAL